MSVNGFINRVLNNSSKLLFVSYVLISFDLIIFSTSVALEGIVGQAGMKDYKLFKGFILSMCNLCLAII